MTSNIPSEITHILLDLGDVLFNIRSEEEWYVNHMLPLVGERFDRLTFKRFYDDFEHGRYGSEEFKLEVEALSGRSFSTTEFEQAWNGRLLDMPVENMNVVRQLSQKYQLYLLSNTNEIHYQSWWNTIIENFGPTAFEEAFQDFFYSHKLGVMKPDPEIYRLVHERIGVSEKGQCFFFDDNAANVKGAIDFGWNSMVIKNNFSEVLHQLGLL